MLKTKTNNGVAAERIIVIDPSLTDFLGHHAQYDISVIENASRLGIKGTVLSNKLVNDSIGEEIPVIRTFSEDMWGALNSCRFGWLELKLFVIGCIASLVVPVLAHRNLARLRRWMTTILNQQKLSAVSAIRLNNSVIKFLVYIFVNLAPHGLYSVKFSRQSMLIIGKLYQLLMPPALIACFNIVLTIRRSLNIGRRLESFFSYILPPILFCRIKIRNVFGFLLKIIYVVSLSLIPRFILKLGEGVLGKLRISNFIGSISPGFLCFFFNNPRYYLEAQRGLFLANLSRGDMVFFHMVIGRNILETASLCEAIYSKTQVSPVVLLRYPPNFLSSIHPFCYKLAIRKIEYLFDCGKLRLASDSSRLVSDYSKFTYVPIELFPIPHGAAHAQSSVPTPQVKSRITIASLGNARGEKGFIEIFKMMQLIAKSDIKSLVRFVVQANAADGDAAPYVEKLRKTRFPFPVNVITKALGKEAYEDVVANSDVILAPYWSEIYASRTSGVALEAIVAGKILITTEDTWMADQVRLWKTGFTIKNRSPSELARAVMRAVNNADALVVRARTASLNAAIFHSGQSFIDHILRRKISSVKGPRELCFFYPWGDLFQNSTGASVRSSLVINKILNSGWQVRVFSAPIKSTLIPKGVKVFSLNDAGSSFNNPIYLADFIQRLVFSRGLIGLEDFQYRFRIWCRSRDFKMLLNSTFISTSAVFLEYEFLASLVRPFATAHNVNMVVSSLDVLGHQSSGTRVAQWVIDQEAKALMSADSAFCISAEDKDVFEKRGVKLSVIENSINLDTFHKPDHISASKYIARSGYRLPQARFGLFVGSAHAPNFTAAKFIAKLSADHLMQQNGIGFVSVGGCHLPDLREEFKNFVQLGYVSREVLRFIYALASFVIIPLESGTGSSIKTIEAFGYGKLVFGTGIAFRGIPVVDQNDCIVVNSLDDYPSQIVKVLDDPEVVCRLEKNAEIIAMKRDYRTTFQPIVDALEVGN